MSKEKSNSFIKGAAILGVAAIIIKLMGAVFRIPLGNMIGDMGMSYYQSAYPIYNYLLVISTAGVPTAIAKIISEKIALGDHKGADKVLRTSLIMMIIVGSLFSLSLFLFSGSITAYVKNPNAIYSILAITPAIFFVSLMSVYRGYFQGYQHMEVYAYSQIIEQFTRVTIGFLLAYLFLKKGVEYSAAGATFGATIGAFFGSVLIIYMYLKFKRDVEIDLTKNFKEESSKDILKNLLNIAIPITLGASILPIMTVFDLAIVMRRLIDVGYTTLEANKLYGQLTGYAQTVVNLPQVVTSAVQISIVPAISRFTVLKDDFRRNHTIEVGLRLALIIGLPSSVGLALLSGGIMRLLYPFQTEIASNIGAILGILGFGVVFLSIFQITTGILQGLGRQKLPALNLFYGAILKLILSYVLVGIKILNIKGAAIATVSAYALASFLNFRSMAKVSKLKIKYKEVFLKPIIDVFVMVIVVIVVRFVVTPFSDKLATLLSVFIGGFTYIIMLFVTNTITEEELRIIPYGSKLKSMGRFVGRFRRKNG